MSPCIFCRIVSGEIPADEVERTAEAVVIRDLNPQAPDHFLVIPLAHAANLSEFVDAQPEAGGALLRLAAKVGRAASNDGYRVVINEGNDGGQTVGHLHVHVLAGRHMGWPPG